MFAELKKYMILYIKKRLNKIETNWTGKWIHTLTYLVNCLSNNNINVWHKWETRKQERTKAAAYKVQLINISETYELEKLKEIMKVGLKESPTI